MNFIYKIGNRLGRRSVEYHTCAKPWPLAAIYNDIPKQSLRVYVKNTFLHPISDTNLYNDSFQADYFFISILFNRT